MNIFVCLMMIVGSFNFLAIGEKNEVFKENSHTMNNKISSSSNQIEFSIIPQNVDYLKIDENNSRIYNFKTPKTIVISINIKNIGNIQITNLHINLAGDSISPIINHIEFQNIYPGKIISKKLIFTVIKDKCQAITINASWLNSKEWSKEIILYPWMNIKSYIGQKDIVNIAFSKPEYLENFKNIPGLEKTELISKTSHDNFPESDWLILRISSDYNDFASRILSRPEIKWIDPYLIKPSEIGGATSPGSSYTPNDPDYLGNAQWGLAAIHASNAWGYRINGISTIIAFLDSGLWIENNFPTHYDLSYGGIPGCNEIVGGGCQSSITEYPQDDYGHGTAVTSVAVAQINNNHGMAGVGNISYMPIKVLDSTGGYPQAWKDAGTVDTHVSYAIKYAYQHGAKVISMSLTTTTTFSPTLNAEINNAYSNYGCVLVAASGNGNSDFYRWFPSGYSRVIAVGAVQQNAGNYIRWDEGPGVGSNYGNHLRLVAPGKNIYGALRDHQLGQEYYPNWKGTSFAVPFVSGTAALMMAVNPALTNGDIIGILTSTAQQTTAPDDTAGWDPKYGYGLLDTGAAVQKAYSQMTPISGGVRLTNAIRNSIYPTVQINGNTIYVVWSDYRDYSNSNSELYLKKLDQNGYQIDFGLGVYEKRLTNFASGKSFPSIQIGPDGDIWAFWYDGRNAGYPNLYFQRYSPSGIPRYANDIRITTATNDLFWDPVSFYIWGSTGSEKARLVMSYDEGSYYCNLKYFNVNRAGVVTYTRLIAYQYSGSGCFQRILHPIILNDRASPGTYHQIMFMNYTGLSGGGLPDYNLRHWRTDSNSGISGTSCILQCYQYPPLQHSYLESYNLLYDAAIDSNNVANFVLFGRHTTKMKWIFMLQKSSGPLNPYNEVEIDTETYPSHTPNNYDVRYNLNVLIDSNNLIHYFYVNKTNEISYREIRNDGIVNTSAVLRSNWLTHTGFSPVGVLESSGTFVVLWSDFRSSGNSEIYFAIDATYWTQFETRLSTLSKESFSPISLSDKQGNVENVWIEYSSPNYYIRYKQIKSDGSIISNIIDGKGNP